MNIKRIENKNLKSIITKTILEKLPKWFGLPDANKEYIKNVADTIFFAAYNNEEVIGFISIKIHNQYTAEIYVFGVVEEYHRGGIGTSLLLNAVNTLRKDGYKILMVKTLGDSHPDIFYQKTRKFYKKVGFYPLEEFKQIWDESNPCLIMVKVI